MLHDYSGERLRVLRKRAMLTQAQVVKMTGICVRTLYSLEKGVRRPQTRTLSKLRNLYAVQIQLIKNQNAIFEGTENGGNITPQATIGSGSLGINAVRTPEKSANERALPVPHGLSRIPR